MIKKERKIEKIKREREKPLMWSNVKIDHYAKGPNLSEFNLFFTKSFWIFPTKIGRLNYKVFTETSMS